MEPLRFRPPEGRGIELLFDSEGPEGDDDEDGEEEGNPIALDKLGNPPPDGNGGSQDEVKEGGDGADVFKAFICSEAVFILARAKTTSGDNDPFPEDGNKEEAVAEETAEEVDEEDDDKEGTKDISIVPGKQTRSFLLVFYLLFLIGILHYEYIFITASPILHRWH